MNDIESAKEPDIRPNRVIGKSDIAVAGVLFAIIVIMAIGRSAHYLLFHTMAELFAIVVSFSIFMLTWVAQRYLISGYLIVLGGAYGAIGLVDVFHTLTFNGMNLFPGVSTNYPTQFWLIARFLEALALVCAPLAIGKKPNFYSISAGFTALGLAASGAVTLHWFPATFVDGVGLTLFKIYAEYIIIAMMIIGLVMLNHMRRDFQPKIFALLAASLCMAIVTEFCFTLYANFYDFTNELGHYFRFLSVVLTLLAIVLSGLRHPFEFIFKEMDELNTRLTRSEKQLNWAQFIAKVGSWHLDIPSQTLTWSTETYRMFGAPVGSPQTFETFASYIHPDDLASVFTAWGQALKGEPYDIEHRIVIGDQIRWVREIAELTFAADGTALAGLGTVQDITEIKQTQELLQASEAFNVSVFNSVVESVAVLDEQGVILAVNGPWQRFALENGALNEANDFVGQSYLNNCISVGTAGVEDAGMPIDVAAGIVAVLNGEIEEFNLEYPCHSPDRQRWFHLRVSPLRGARTGAVVAHENITERILAQNALRASEESYRRQFSDNTAVMLLLDPSNGTIVEANAAAVAFYGYPQSHMSGMPISVINPSTTKDQALKYMKSVASGDSKRFEFQHRLATGSTRYVEAFASQILMVDRLVLHVIIHDITERQLAQEALSSSEERHRLLFDTSIDGIMLTAPDGRIFSANKSACDMLERTEEEIQHVGRDGVVDLNDPRLAMSLEERQRTGKSVGERVFVRKDGSKFPCDVSSTMYSDKDGNLRTSVIFRDITERKRVENALQESEARMSAVFQSSPLGIVISKIADGTILDINDATLHLFGYSREEVVGQRTVADLGAYVNPAQRDEMMKLLRQQGSVQNLHIEYRTRNDKHMVLEVSGRIVILRGESCLLAMMGDVTQRIQAEVKVHEQAFRDSLTRLPNRRLLKDRLQQSIAVSRRSACYGALMFVDLDNFKPLNDTHGHEVGDLLLIEAANRLNGCVREMDTVARLGGDEFVVVLNELNSELLISTEQAQAVAEKIRHELSGVYLLVPKTEGAVNSGIEHRCTASIGVALFGVNHASSSQEVLKWADEAMYQAKHAGRNSVRFYEPS